MLRNNNEIAINRIAKRSMKSNRTRNIFAVIAIILTTFMFTTVFSIGFSMAKNMSTMLVRQQGTKSSIYIDNPTKEQINQAKKIKGINAAGIRVHAGDFFTDKDESVKITIDYYDTTEFDKNLSPAISDIKGTYPVEENEIMLSQSALDTLGITTPEKNMNVTLELSDGEKTTFNLSGWYKDYQYFHSELQAFVSEKYISANNMTIENSGVLSISCKLDKNDLVYDELLKMSLNDGQEITPTFDMQSETSSNTVIIAIVILIMGLIIIFSGYLLIYNVIYISVTKDIRFFGMLKTIGTSPKQIKKIVNMQSVRLSIIGIPIGVILGALASFGAVPMALNMFNGVDSGTMPNNVGFNPFIYVGTIIFALFTVFLSCKKPAKFASNVSPVEAMKYNGLDNKKITARKTTDGGKLYKMAYRNVFREKKRAILVFASLFMGTLAFLSVNTFFGSLKIENYIKRYLPNDYEIYVSGEDEHKQSAENMKKSFSEIKGITKIETMEYIDIKLKFDKNLFAPFIDISTRSVGEDNMSEMVDNYESGKTDYATSIIKVSSDTIEEYNKKASNKIDIDDFEKGEVAIIGNVAQEGDGDELLGKTISMTDSETGKQADIKIGSVMVINHNYGIPILDSHTYVNGDGTPGCIYVSENFISKLNEKLRISIFFIDCDKDAEPVVTARVKEIVKSNSAVYAYSIKSEEILNFKSSITGMTILTSGMSIILILIGIINFINVMVTGVFTRRQELAVMESVGMTKNQIKKMLMYEGLYYGVITTLLIMSFGNGIIFILANLAQKIADYAVFYYPWALMMGIIVTIFVICVIVPAVVYKQFSKESVTERLRASE